MREYTIVAQGAGETVYNNATIIIGNEDITPDDVQKWGDAWKEDLGESKLDRFGDLDIAQFSISDIAAAMPKEWDAKVGDDTAHMLFL